MGEEQGRSTLSDLQLREVLKGDLPIFFEHQLDPVAVHMAAFTTKDPADQEAFDAHWRKIATDPTIISRTILYGDMVAGSIVSFEMEGDREVSYWLGREYWGQGVATKALAFLLNIIQERPLLGRAATSNIGSIRVLQKCGFLIIGEDKGYANARGEEIAEFIFRLD